MAPELFRVGSIFRLMGILRPPTQQKYAANVKGVGLYGVSKITTMRVWQAIIFSGMC